MNAPAPYQLQRLQRKAMLLVQAAAADVADYQDVKAEFNNAVAELKFACAELRQERRDQMKRCSA